MSINRQQIDEASFRKTFKQAGELVGLKNATPEEIKEQVKMNGFFLICPSSEGQTYSQLKDQLESVRAKLKEGYKIIPRIVLLHEGEELIEWKKTFGDLLRSDDGEIEVIEYEKMVKPIADGTEYYITVDGKEIMKTPLNDLFNDVTKKYESYCEKNSTRIQERLKKDREKHSKRKELQENKKIAAKKLEIAQQKDAREIEFTRMIINNEITSEEAEKKKLLAIENDKNELIELQNKIVLERKTPEQVDQNSIKDTIVTLVLHKILKLQNNTDKLKDGEKEVTLIIYKNNLSDTTIGDGILNSGRILYGVEDGATPPVILQFRFEMVPFSVKETKKAVSANEKNGQAPVITNGFSSAAISEIQTAASDSMLIPESGEINVKLQSGSPSSIRKTSPSIPIQKPPIQQKDNYIDGYEAGFVAGARAAFLVQAEQKQKPVEKIVYVTVPQASCYSGFPQQANMNMMPPNNYPNNYFAVPNMGNFPPNVSHPNAYYSQHGFSSAAGYVHPHDYRYISMTDSQNGCKPDCPQCDPQSNQPDLLTQIQTLPEQSNSCDYGQFLQEHHINPQKLQKSVNGSNNNTANVNSNNQKGNMNTSNNLFYNNKYNNGNSSCGYKQQKNSNNNKNGNNVNGNNGARNPEINQQTNQKRKNSKGTQSNGFSSNFYKSSSKHGNYQKSSENSPMSSGSGSPPQDEGYGMENLANPNPGYVPNRPGHGNKVC